MTRPTFKKYLSEYDRYFNSFSEVISKDDEDDEKDTKQNARTSDGKKAQQKERDCNKMEKGDEKEGLDPCKFRQWMEISIAGD